MKIFIIICLSVFVCNSQYVDYQNLHLIKTFVIVGEVIKRGEDLDDLFSYLKYSTITSQNGMIRSGGNIKNVISHSTHLINHITKNKFQNGYLIENESLYEKRTNNNGNNIKFLVFKLKVRSKSTKDILWFNFDNMDDGIWKFHDYSFCNNIGFTDEDEPCDKK